MKKLAILLSASLSLGACVEIPDTSRRSPIRQSTTGYSPRPEARQCLAELGTTRAAFTPLPDQYFGGGCSNLNTVRLASLRSDDATLGLANLGPVTCPLAQTFAGWARFGVDRAARQILGSALVRIDTMGSYSCRNVAGTARRSAHATAGAIDIAAFVLADGRRISVLGDWSQGNAAERQFLRVVQQSACKRFGTVLGPAYNADHADHFHVELGGGGFCR